jgi:site-specific DNA-methyltransferase (adenine-specific)
VSRNVVIANESDVFAFLQRMKGAKLAGCITDYPYDTLERFRRSGTTTRLKASDASSNPWFSTMPIDALCDVTRMIYDVLDDNAYAFVYVDESTQMRLMQKLGVVDALEKLVPTSRFDAPKCKIGFGWWTSAVWVKTSSRDDADEWDTHGGSGYHGAACTEKILILEKGKRKLGRFDNAFPCPRYWGKPAWAKGRDPVATPKPIKIARTLMRCASEPGALWFDPFIGSGTHALAAVAEGRSMVANDLSLRPFRSWVGAYVEGAADNLIEETGGKIEFDLRLPKAA